MIKVKYRKPREVLGQWLAENDVGGRWPDYYNDEQREYWYCKADKLMAFIRKNKIL